MSSLYIDRRDVEIRLDSRAIVIYENDERIGTVPLAPVDRVVIRGNAVIRANLLAELGKEGIGVIFLSGRKSEPTLFMPVPHNDAKRRVEQYAKSLDKAFCFRLSKELVMDKLQAQSDLLERERERHPSCRYEITKKISLIQQLQEYVERQKDIASLRGLEGKAGAIYFSAFADFLPQSLEFKGRNRRPPRDPFNAVLSLGYTLLHFEAVTGLYGLGLDPYVGFYHAMDFGRESLACDVIEPLRPLIDQFAIDCFRDKSLRTEGFSSTDQGCLMGKETRVDFYVLYEEKVAALIRKSIETQAKDFIKTLPSQNGFYSEATN